MSEYAEASDEAGGEPVPHDNAPLPDEDAEEKGSSIWLLIALGLLALVLIWILLGVWRYLQVLGYGGS